MAGDVDINFAPPETFSCRVLTKYQATRRQYITLGTTTCMFRNLFRYVGGSINYSREANV